MGTVRTDGALRFGACSGLGVLMFGVNEALGALGYGLLRCGPEAQEKVLFPEQLHSTPGLLFACGLCLLFFLAYLTTESKEIPQIVWDRPSQIYWPFGALQLQSLYSETGWEGRLNLVLELG